MKTLFSQHKWMQLIYGALLLTAGILIIVFALQDTENISKVLSVIVSIGLFIYSAALLFSGVFSLKKKLFDIAFIYAVLFVSVGVVLLCNTEMIGKFITIFVATLITGFGVVEIGEATSMIFFKRPVFFIVMFYILGAAFITLGVLAYAYQENVEKIVYVGVGVLMCLVAALEIVLGVHGLILAIKASKHEKATVIDAEVEDVKQEEKPEEKKEEENKTDLIELDLNDDSHDNSNPQA